VFASSDKGGTGRTVTACNTAFRLSMRGMDVAYLDFDFGSPTAGAVFELEALERGTNANGLHSYLTGQSGQLTSVDVRAATARRALRTAPPGSGRLMFYPGDRGGAEFSLHLDMIGRAAGLFRMLDSEFDVCVVDLSAGRSAAVELCLRALADLSLRSTTVRWLVFHRWTRQHVLAASGLVHGEWGILQIARDAGHDHREFANRLRMVRTAVPDLNNPAAADFPAQAAWLRTCDAELKTLARDQRLGQSTVVGETPLEPMLLWREQIVMDSDVRQQLANTSIVRSFTELAENLSNQDMWESL